MHNINIRECYNNNNNNLTRETPPNVTFDPFFLRRPLTPKQLFANFNKILYFESVYVSLGWNNLLDQ